MKTRHSLGSLLALTGGSLLAISDVHASTLSWDGGTVNTVTLAPNNAVTNFTGTTAGTHFDLISLDGHGPPLQSPAHLPIPSLVPSIFHGARSTCLSNLPI